MQPEDIIKTETGMRMYNAVTPGIYNQDSLQLSIFNANGLIMDEVYQRAMRLHADMMIQNATWSLTYWEHLFRIVPKDSQSFEQRRRAIIIKMNEYFPVTKRRMESIVDAFTENGGTSIDDERGDYIFEVILKEPGVVDLLSMMGTIEEVKPAHLAYLIVYLIQEEVIKLKSKSYNFPVQYRITNTFQTDTVPGKLGRGSFALQHHSYVFDTFTPICGTFVTSTINSIQSNLNVELSNEYRDVDVLYRRAGEQTITGEGEI